MKELNQEMKERFKGYMEQRELMPRTIKEYLSYYDGFAVFNTINQENISKFLSGSKNKNGVARGFLKNFLKFVILNRRELEINDEEYLFIREIELPEQNKRGKRQSDIDVLDFFTIKKIGMGIPDRKHKLMFAVHFYGALRLEEMCNIKYSDFMWDEWVGGGMTGILRLKILGKGGKYRYVFMPTALAKDLYSYFIKDGKKLKRIKDEQGKEQIVEVPVFNIKYEAWRKNIKEYGKRYAGLDIHTHQLRHSFASFLLRKGWDIFKVKEYLGHSDISTTQIYAHLDTADLEEDYKKLGF